MHYKPNHTNDFMELYLYTAEARDKGILSSPLFIIIIIWLYSPIRTLASPKNWGFVTITFLQGWIVSPAPNPQPGGLGLRIYDPRRQGGSALPPRTGYYRCVNYN
jgi:hypothetical protein